MAVTWDGFSEEDICKLKSVSGEGDTKNHERCKSKFGYVRNLLTKFVSNSSIGTI